MFWWCQEAARAVDWCGDCVAWCLCEDWCCTVTVTVTSSEEEEEPLRRPSLTAHTHHRSSPSPSDSSSPSPLPSSLRESIFWRQSTHILKDHFLLSELFVQYLVFGDLQKKKKQEQQQLQEIIFNRRIDLLIQKYTSPISSHFVIFSS